MITYSFYESDSRVQHYAMALRQRGDVVDVISLRREGQPEKEIKDGVNVHRIQLRTVNEQGHWAYAFRILRFCLHSAIVLAKKHLRCPYQLVHVHSVPDFLVFAAVIPKLTGTPVVLDIHDILPELYASKFKVRCDSYLFKLLVFVERASGAFSDHVIIANHLWYQRLISRSVRAQKCTVILNYPELRIFYPRPKSRDDGKFIILYPGTLNWHQGVDIAIRAFSKVEREIPGGEFHIYGEGPARSFLKDMSKQLELDGKIVFREFLPMEDIAKVMANGDLAIVPKRASSPFGNEAVSTKIMEFMSVGVPVIVSKTLVDSYYHDEQTVAFFESENVDDLADRILLLVRDRALRTQLVSNAAKYVEVNNWDVKKREYLDLIDSLVKHENTGASA